MKVNFKSEKNELLRHSKGAAGFDLSSVHAHYNITPNTLIYISTGISLEIPEGYVGLIFERSSLHGKGLSLINKVGVIDSDYRGIIQLILKSDRYTHIEEGERLAQIVIFASPYVEFMQVGELSETERGHKGIGSTGTL